MTEERKHSACSLTGPGINAVIGILAIIAVLLAVSLNKPVGTNPVEFKPVIQVKQPEPPQINTLSANGESKLTLTPDKAVAYISIVTDDNNTAKGAQEKNRPVADAVTRAIKGLGVSASDIETDSYSLVRREEWDTDESKYVDRGYRLTHTLKVTTKKINEVGALIDACVGAGANGVDRVTFELSDGSEKKAREGILKKAAEAAIQKARRLAKLANVTLVQVTNVGESSYYTPYDYYNTKYDMSAASGSVPTNIAPQKVEITGSVYITYEIK